MLLDYSMLGLLTTLVGGSEHAFWSFYARVFDYFARWIRVCFLMFYVFWPWEHPDHNALLHCSAKSR